MTTTDSTACPQLVLALVTPIGVDREKLLDALGSAFGVYRYAYEIIQVSDLIKEFGIGIGKIDKERFEAGTYAEKKHSLIQLGDEIRSESKTAAYCACMTIEAIRHKRAGDFQKRVVFVVNSIKNDAEIALLRKVYGNRLIVVAVINSYEERKDYLKKKLHADCVVSGKNEAIHDAEVEKLINEDRMDEHNKTGQQVIDCIPLADFFIKSTNSEQLKRSLALVLGDPNTTPTAQEQSMFFAYAASLKSADLSRQVGAAIVGKIGEILSTGCNDVPKPGGGYFWDDEEFDMRDKELEIETNQSYKEGLFKEVIDFIPDEVLSAEEKDKLVRDAMSGQMRQKYKQTRIANLIEFGRMVHAEMAAITDAARRGVAIEGSKLFCTTLPCHMCAKLIISSGIESVVYIEPYKKSLSADLFNKLIHLKDESPGSSQDPIKPIEFRQYIGVSPHRYIEFFASTAARKDSKGRIVKWEKTEAMPRHEFLFDALDSQEKAALTLLENHPKIKQPKDLPQEAQA